MAYTPPNWDSVDFQFAANTYVPQWDQVDFSFAPAGSLSAQIPVFCDITAVPGISGDLSAEIPFFCSAEGIAGPIGYLAIGKIELLCNIGGDQPPAGYVDAQIPGLCTVGQGSNCRL